MELLKFAAKHLIISILLVAGFIALSYLLFFSRGSSVFETVIAARGNIKQEVSVTGKVRPVENVDLAFDKTGKVSRAYVKIGDKVLSGQFLAELDSSELLAQLAEYQAGADVQKARLAELNKGTRPEEIIVQEIKVANVKTAVEDAKKNLIDKINDAYIKSDDVIRNKTDQYFVNLKSSDPQITFIVYDNALKESLETSRLSIEATLTAWRASLQGLAVLSDFNSYINTARLNLNDIKNFLTSATMALNDLTPGTTITQTTIDTYRADTSTARTNINTAVVNLTAADEKLKTAESDLTLAESELALKKAGTIEEQISAQEAQVRQAEAKVGTVQTQISKNILRSPIGGIVTRQDARVGEIVTVNSEIISIISENRLEIEANIPEADIGKVRVGNMADVTLDAYGSEVIFKVKVVKIDPAETMIEGVATYKATFMFIADDPRVMSGMTANIDILTAIIDSAIAVPARAVYTKDSDRFVKILKDGEASEVRVIAGLRGSDGKIEITSGLEEGDLVIIK